MSPTLRAYLELARLSNAPTVVSNALLGSALGGLASGATLADAGWAAIAAPAAACTMLYVSGMALNDLADRAIDARERPKRPIPSGRATPRGAAAFASVLVVAALGLLSLTTVPSLVAGIVLLVLIVLYDLTHARTAATVALMGACRGMVYVVAALAIAPLAAPTIVIGPALCLAVYVAAFSITARREASVPPDEPAHACGRCGHLLAGPSSKCPECGSGAAIERGPRPGRFLRASMLLPLPLAAALLFLPRELFEVTSRRATEIATVVGGLVAGFLLLACLYTASKLLARRPPPIGRAVTLWIASIALFDSTLLFLLRSVPLAIVALACFALTRWAQRRIAGT